MCSLSFMFQAEDGIRDYKVTGVQTCALPISGIAEDGVIPALDADGREQLAADFQAFAAGELAEDFLVRRARQARRRSEERRVGKACRSRRDAYDANNKITRDSREYRRIPRRT